ncbi:MAG TPA: metal-dependent hydrolase [Chitinophagaceae bacterium]|nr:metal-dependent hydrolase [Chitinophagaceae bacterium]
MYAINHAATALILKKQDARISLFYLLVSVQLMELFWIFFSYTGLEHSQVLDGMLHLDFLPYSHSVCSALVLAAAVYFIGRQLTGRSKPAWLLAIGVVSHLLLDLLTHEPDIRLSPFSSSPSFGLGITLHPGWDFMLETLFGVLCWAYYGGSRALLLTILGLNVLNIPFMFARGSGVTSMAAHPGILPSIILFQILLSWWLVYRFSAEGSRKPPGARPA